MRNPEMKKYDYSIFVNLLKSGDKATPYETALPASKESKTNNTVTCYFLICCKALKGHNVIG
jgi:hypothetical protein